MSPSRDLSLGFVRLHGLYHAGREPVCGLWLIDELARHGCDISAGTRYPILHSLEQEGLTSSERRVVEGKMRKYYHLTSAGEEALDRGRDRAVEQLGEIQAT